MTTVNKIESGKVELNCKIEGQNWKDACKKAFNKLSKNLEVKGFRKGQVPENIVKQHISDQQVYFEACEAIAQETLINAVKETDTELIDRPELKMGDINENECNIIFVCPVIPDVKLGDYSSIKYEVADVAVDDSEVNNELERYREQKANLELKEDGNLEKGEVAVIDFEGFKDGVAFEGGKGENFELTIGSGQFIPGFEDKLIGMKSEEERDIDVTFPENYHVDDLKGKPVVFKVKLHEIKKKVLPELNEEFVKSLKLDKVETIDQFKEHVKKSLLDSKKYEAENKASEKLVEDLITKIEVDIPEKMIENEKDSIVSDYSQRLMSQGIQLDQFLKMTGQDVKSFKEGFKDEAVKRIKTTLALKEIARKESLTPTAEEVEEDFKKLADQYKMKIEEIKKYIDESQIKSDLTLRKALDFLKK